MDKIDRLKRHIEVLTKSYDNIILVMDDDLEMEKDKDGKETDQFALKDDKIKIFAEGVKKSAETLDFLFSEITKKQAELEYEISAKAINTDTKQESKTIEESIDEPKKKNSITKHLQ